MKQIVILLAFLLGITSVVSADNLVKKGLRMVDNMAELRDTTIDSNYIRLPKEKWMIGFKAESFSNPATVRTIDNWEYTRYNLDTNLQGQLGIIVGYKGLQFTLNIDRLYFKGNFSNQDMTFTYYKHRWGLDLTYMDQSKLECSQNNKSGVNLFSDDLRLRSLTLNAYYVFNHKKFSMPAVFLQTYRQIKSAGSWMLGAQAYWGYMTLKERLENSFFDQSLNMLHFAIGGGYGYNWVPNKHWVVHVSAMPHILPFYYYKSGESRVDYSFPPVYIMGRVQVLYYWKTQFIGFNANVQTTHLGSADQCSMTNTFWRAKLFYGVKF